MTKSEFKFTLVYSNVKLTFRKGDTKKGKTKMSVRRNAGRFYSEYWRSQAKRLGLGEKTICKEKDSENSVWMLVHVDVKRENFLFRFLAELSVLRGKNDRLSNRIVCKEGKQKMRKISSFADLSERLSCEIMF